MLSRTLGITALAAATANAILIPPSIAAADFGDDNAMEISVNPLKRTVAIECTTCDFAAKQDNNLVWTQNGGNSFLLDFEVGTNEDTLDIDGVQLYPPTFGYFTAPFFVTQVDPASKEDLKLRVTGYNFYYSTAKTVSEAGTELLPMTFRITSIEGKSVDTPAVTINLLKAASGRLMIASFQTAKTTESSPDNQEKECEEWPLLCKWKSILADRINGLKSSVKKGCHQHKSGSTAKQNHKSKASHVLQPGHKHHGPHHMDGHVDHHDHHRMHMFLRRAFFTILLPILIGICAGTLTYLIGMALGCVIAVVVAKVRGCNPYQRIALEDEPAEVVVRDEKKVYAELPEYDSPPVYEEAAEKEVV